MAEPVAAERRSAVKLATEPVDPGPVHARDSVALLPTPPGILLARPAESPQSEREANSGDKRRVPVLRLLPTLLLLPVLAGVVYVAVTGDGNPPGESGGAAASPDALSRSAEEWLIDNVERDDRLIVDAAMASDLLSAGWNGSGLLAYEDVGRNRPPSSDPLTAWQEAHYLVTTDALRAREGDLPEVTPAIENSVVVAAFGTGIRGVEIRRIVPEGASAAAAAESMAASVRAAYGGELARNPALRMSDSDRALLTEGRVDDRIAVVLAALAAQGEVMVAGFPVIDGEEQEPVRQVALAGLAGTALVAGDRPTADADGLLEGLEGRYAPVDVLVEGKDLVLRYSLPINTLFD